MESDRLFRKTVTDYFDRHGRILPWRSKTTTPYHILVSEFMLQQTQVDRVKDKYSQFIKKFPTPQKLANASVREVYDIWSGLGYNRRALALQKTAKTLISNYNGRVPKNTNELEALPGIGPYTARAVRVFAYNIPDIVIETNIRTVYIHHFFKNSSKVQDNDLVPFIEKTLDTKNPRRWYSALMDYGAMLKKEYGNSSRQSSHHVKQSRFEGSRRQQRGKILKLLHTQKGMSLNQISKQLTMRKGDAVTILEELAREGFIKKANRNYQLK